ncbi:hypothetical protein K466DRAFT_65326 [Polyporus arcularius HHB13444]|uniref:Uncharacterized protein n=1 Tax=Polyporus arcularius HHB13444 TaxID=1314778 RepID=A0A5C3PK84_9APHY|nr:hypothetical protein K466DRAFT_65326 [Polyporus arcularius HHB13444]
MASSRCCQARMQIERRSALQDTRRIRPQALPRCAAPSSSRRCDVQWTRARSSLTSTQQSWRCTRELPLAPSLGSAHPGCVATMSVEEAQVTDGQVERVRPWRGLHHIGIRAAWLEVRRALGGISIAICVCASASRLPFVGSRSWCAVHSIRPGIRCHLEPEGDGSVRVLLNSWHAQWMTSLANVC